MSADKMNTSEVFEMFETINNKLDKRQIDKSTEPAQIDTRAINTMTERFEKVMEEARKPVKVEHRHTIDIGSSRIFISLVVMALTILGLSYAVGEQRQIISQYRDNDLKYRYIKMQGQANEENFYLMEQQFRYGDSIRVIRRQVEKYEELVHEQAERIERIRHNAEKAEKLGKEVEKLRMNKLKSN
ncbi:MAG: hypothetical protein LBT24_06195 [Tannerella sp.]|jgi:hypothetical protein|nr:hypothetical protein [Tannerella sp.]